MFYLKDGFNGRSFGKLLFGLAVINRNTGSRAGFLTSIKALLAVFDSRDSVSIVECSMDGVPEQSI